MPEPQLRKFGQLATAHLEPEERLLDVGVIQPLRGASGVGLGVPRVLGEAIAQMGAVKGERGSIADGFPHDLPIGTNLLCVTDRRVLFLYTGARKTAQLLWQLPRSSVAKIERRPRLQVMAKFRLHFQDGSSVSVLTMRRRTIESLAAALGSQSPK